MSETYESGWRWVIPNHRCSAWTLARVSGTGMTTLGGGGSFAKGDWPGHVVGPAVLTPPEVEAIKAEARAEMVQFFKGHIERLAAMDEHNQGPSSSVLFSGVRWPDNEHRRMLEVFEEAIEARERLKP